LQGKKWWYPICGFRWGWCLNGNGCYPMDNSGTKTYVTARDTDTPDCKYFTREHPVIGTKPILISTKRRR